MGIIFESKCRRRTRHRIEDLITAYGRKLTTDEVRYEFWVRGIRSPLRAVIESILAGPGEGYIFYETLEEVRLGRNRFRLKEESDGRGGLQWCSIYV